jgi:hypothetical protein
MEVVFGGKKVQKSLLQAAQLHLSGQWLDGGA